MSKGTAVRIAGAIVLVAVLLGAYALMNDALGGFYFSRSAKTWGGWAAGLVLLGLIYVLAEGGFEWATEADRTTDPLGKRLARLFFGFAVAAAILLLAGIVYTLFA